MLVARHADGSDFADVIITTTNPNACIDGDSRLGRDEVGIVVLKVYNGDPDIGDACLRWPIRRLFYHGAISYMSVYDHARKRSAIEAEYKQNRKRKGKRQYHYDRRVHAIAIKARKTKLVSWESIAYVYEQNCCEQQCTQKFCPSTICTLRTEMHLQTFQLKCTKYIEVHKAMHGGFVTVEGINICPQAWRIIYNVLRRTFDRYKAKAKKDVRGAPHGNCKRTKAKTATVQAIQTLRSLLEASADHIPNLSRTLPNGKKVGLKVLPAGTEWKHLLAAVNDVRITSITTFSST